MTMSIPAIRAATPGIRAAAPGALALAPLALAPLALALAGCEGGGGVVSTPSFYNYQTLDQLAGNQTFQSAGVHWQSGPSNRAADAFGAGLVFAYNAASDTFTVTPPGGATASFDSTTYQPTQSTLTSRVFVRGSGATQQTLRLSRPTVGGVTLSYLETASFLDGTTATTWTAVGGVPTQANDVPRSGTATYSAETGATVLANSLQYNALPGAGSSATFSANFGASTVATSVHLVGMPTTAASPVDFGTFTGTGTISATGPGFTGSFANTTGAGFSGAFFGPQAAEAAYAYNFIGTWSGGSLEAFGATYAKKN